MANMVWAGYHGAALHEEPGNVLVTSEMLTVAVREDHHVPGVRV